MATFKESNWGLMGMEKEAPAASIKNSGSPQPSWPKRTAVADDDYGL